MTWPFSSFFWNGLPSGDILPAVDQSHDSLVATPPRAKLGTWQVWQAILLAWSFSLLPWLFSWAIFTGCGLSPWQASQVVGFLVSALPRKRGPPLSFAVGA